MICISSFKYIQKKVVLRFSYPNNISFDNQVFAKGHQKVLPNVTLLYKLTKSLFISLKSLLLGAGLSICFGRSPLFQHIYLL